ncbi:MAG TPA: hypothetical protein VK856_14275 [Anaerolineaceae bacterium]|nr:hypothetical protein [Anaerolineaceae bacterium]
MNFLPGIVLSLLFAMLIGFAFHFWKGGGLLRLITIIIFSIVGFSIGHWIGFSQNINFLRVGMVYLGFGILGSIIFSFIALWITNLRLEK